MGKLPKPISEEIPQSWRTLANQKKTYLGWPEWSYVPRLPTGARARSSGHKGLQTAAAEVTEAVVQLADEHGVGLEGVRLRITAWAFRRERDVTATLEIPGGRTFVTIARVDAWPSDPHIMNYDTSKKAKNHPKLRHLPVNVEGCHVHRFDQNAVLGRAAFAPYDNLPVAEALPNRLQSFRDFLRTVSHEFKIGGIDVFDGPDWGQMI